MLTAEEMLGPIYLVIGHYEPKRFDAEFVVEYSTPRGKKYEMHGVWLDVPPAYWRKDTPIVVELEQIHKTLASAHSYHSKQTRKRSRIFDGYIPVLTKELHNDPVIVTRKDTRKDLLDKRSRILDQMKKRGLELI